MATITIPAQTVTSPLTVNGTKINLSIAIPAQAITIPDSSGGLPAGLTWSNGVFTVAGSITASQVTLTGGPTLPPSDSGLYVLQLVNGVLEPVAYPPISAASTAANTITLTNK